MASKTKSRAKSKANPAQCNRIEYQQAVDWMNESGGALYHQIKTEIDSPLIIITLPNVAPAEVCIRLLDVILDRIEAEGFTLPSMIVHSTE